MLVYASMCEICHAESIPNLMQLVLTGNRLKNLAVSLSVAGAWLCLLPVKIFHMSWRLNFMSEVSTGLMHDGVSQTPLCCFQKLLSSQQMPHLS